MGAVGVRYSYILASAIENEFIHHETMPFLEWHLHRYGRSYGDKRDLYKRPDATKNQTIRLPPTLAVLEACQDGPFLGLIGEPRKRMAKKLHTRFVTEISGV